ncbi:L-threonylcarbamoyladenylate synthase [Pararhizobium mangrovi]|uniref:Threonylcarbamoyl-AMP synthase n=1 Tax=Pararhizobium mangrovi TaxID=2590452 RepID=A0A506TVW4_9HYPH|nr:L-threonylcarbamoyladenylate synthase [Pararhizobium mangrovi]TPW26212.1 threonylcarbamoyl-AMP synthase [Pararhizobium mangrovi]
MADVIDIEADRDFALARGRALLAAGFPIAVPTETVYGLAADATNAQAIARIYEAKVRPQFNPLICHVSDRAMAERLATFDPVSRRLTEAFWPGPLTIVLPLAEASPVHPLATAGLETVGLRMPIGFTADLIEAFGRPLAAPSANTSGRVSPTRAAHVADDLGFLLPTILDGGPTGVGVESTIVKVVGDAVHLLRPGGVTAEAITEAIGLPVTRGEGASPAIQAPGMLASHYAPTANVRLNATSVAPDETLLRFGQTPVEGEKSARAVLDLSAEGDLREAAARLFDVLRAADATGAKTIAVMPIPESGLGEAINDRLRRAAAERP